MLLQAVDLEQLRLDSNLEATMLSTPASGSLLHLSLLKAVMVGEWDGSNGEGGSEAKLRR